jgi:hypothetical protein
MSKKPTADPIPQHERPLGRMLADSTGKRFEPLRSLQEAQADVNGYVILQGDDGGQIYVVAAAHSVRCSEETLRQLLREIDEIEWPGNPDNMRGVFFERLGPNSAVAGGMGGGVVETQPWVHKRLEAQGMREAILQVLRGEQVSLR